MKKIYLISIFAIVSHGIFAQNNYTPDTVMSRFFLLERLTGEKYMDAGHRNEGMYFFEEWTQGKIVLVSGEVINNLTLHYNGFQDQLLWLKDKLVQIILDKQNISEFSLFKNGGSYNFKKYNIPNGKDSTETYCQELYSGKVKLVVIRRNKLDAEIVKYYLLFYTYVPKPVYFLLKAGNIYKLKNARLRAIYKAFPDRREILRLRVRQQHLKVKSEADFIRVVQGLEDLI
jgi:hypothetical protein